MTPNHCVSLEIAKEMKEAGWEKPTEFWWAKIEEGTLKQKDWRLTQTDRQHMADFCTYHPAPLATEILEELPVVIIRKLRGNIKYSVERKRKFFTDDILPNALAKMWLYLKKEGLIK